MEKEDRQRRVDIYACRMSRCLIRTRCGRCAKCADALMGDRCPAPPICDRQMSAIAKSRQSEPKQSPVEHRVFGSTTTNLSELFLATPCVPPTISPISNPGLTQNSPRKQNQHAGRHTLMWDTTWHNAGHSGTLFITRRLAMPSAGVHWRIFRRSRGETINQ